jgi:uncharacterized protein YqeY
MSLSEQIVSDLTAAMKAQDAQRTSTLRMVKAAMMNRKIEKGSELDDDEMQKLLRSLVKQRRDSVEQYEKAGRQELVDKETAEIAVIEAYLPQAASAAEIEARWQRRSARPALLQSKTWARVMKAAQASLAAKMPTAKSSADTVKAS